MVGSYRGEGTSGRCVWGVGITGGGYTSRCDCGRDPRILPEYAQLVMTVSGVERRDCSAVATSSAQVGIHIGWGGGCDVGAAVCAVEKIGGGCGTWVLPCRSSSCDELGGPTAVEGELVFLSIYRWSSPELEEEVAGEGSGFTRAFLAVSTDCGYGEDCSIVKSAAVCIPHSGSGIGGGSTNGVRGEGKMSSTSSMMWSYAFGSTFGGIGELPSPGCGNCSRVTKKLKSVIYECLVNSRLVLLRFPDNQDYPQKSPLSVKMTQNQFFCAIPLVIHSIGKCRLVL